MKYIPHANSRFVRSLNKWIWCGFQSKAKIETRYSTAKSNVSYKETPAKKGFSLITPRSASFKIYFLCEFTWCPFKTGEKAFNFKSYRIPNLQFYLFAVDSNHSSSKFNTWTKIKKYIFKLPTHKEESGSLRGNSPLVVNKLDAGCCFQTYIAPFFYANLPIVRSWTGWKRLSVNCSKRHDFPTPRSTKNDQSSQTLRTNDLENHNTINGVHFWSFKWAQSLTRIPTKRTAGKRIKIYRNMLLTCISYNNVLKKICVRHFNDWISSFLSFSSTVYDVIPNLFMRERIPMRVTSHGMAT